MYNAVEQISAAGKWYVESFEAVSGHMLSGVEQLSQLNLAVSRAVVTESFDQVESLMSVRDPQQLFGLQVGLVQPMAEKSASYGRQVYDILQSTGSEIAKVAEAKMNEAQQAFVAVVDDAVKNAPVGSEAAMALFKNAFSASQEAIQTAQNAARQAVATTESNMEAVAEQTSGAVKTAARKR